MQLSLDCSVEDAIGPVVFHWHKADDVNFVRKQNGRVNITSTASSSILLFDQVSLFDDGMYYCTSADYFSDISKEFNISVNGEPGTDAYIDLNC